MRKSYFAILIIFVVAIAFSGCDKNKQKLFANYFKKKGRSVPTFSADSSYDFVAKQVAFGPRVPNSKAHDKDRSYLTHKLDGYAGVRYVYSQDFQITGYNKVKLHLSNIIASFNPTDSDRIMLCTHWDTRPYSDQDPDTAYRNIPIPGADDGGSGVGVLLELARMFKKTPPPIGVDLIFFDGEDYGKGDQLSYYFLGSRYWANHQPVKNYDPRFGILLDMVGAKGATFPKEEISMHYGPQIVNGIWKVADQMGYRKLFVDKMGGAISDDHVILDQVLDFPTIDIIDMHKNKANQVKFPWFWHTHHDNMKIISKKTLQDVGNVLCELIYNRI